MVIFCSSTDIIDFKLSVIHLPAVDVIRARGVLAQHVSVAHVSSDLHGDAVQVDVLPGSVSEVHAAEGSSPAGELPPQVPGVQVTSSSSLAAADPPVAVTVSHRGGVACLQARARLAQSP